MSETDPTQVLFVPDMARRLGITVKAVRRRLDDERGSLPRPRRGRVNGGAVRVYWTEADLLEWQRGGRRPRR